MPLFEEQPWLLVPIIIVTVEAWGAFKGCVMATYKRRRGLDTKTR